MPSAAYYRRQAETCLQVAGRVRDSLASEALRDLAVKYYARALDVERKTADTPAYMVGLGGPAGDDLSDSHPGVSS
jgi:hypothetical protein